MSPVRKRVFDVVGGGAALLLLLPVFAVLAALVRIRLGSPVLFTQQRPGLRGAPFTIYKFRTMTEAKAADGSLLPDANRLTGLGRVLRATSLDEIPELFNVLKGDMSLVGPRPLFMRYLPYYSPREQLRHAVRPGITGWAQIHGRNRIPWDARLAMDVWYVEHWCLGLDLRILARSIWHVISRTGVSVNSAEIETDLTRERQAAPGARHVQ